MEILPVNVAAGDYGEVISETLLEENAVMLYNVYEVIVMMRRTQLYLEEDKYQFIKTIARSRKKSMAEFVREIIYSYMNKFEKDDSLYDIIGIADVPEDNVAARYEDFLYGDKDI